MQHLNLLTSKKLSLPIVVVIFSLVLAACAPSQNPAAVPPEAAGNSVQSVQVAENSQFGKILAAANGMTLYTFAIDTPGVSNCTDSGCVANWPPYTVDAQPTAGSSVPGKLSTITRSDGSRQVTYNGSPLYSFAFDKNPGEATGDGLNDFGGIWHVVSVGSASGNTLDRNNSAGNAGSEEYYSAGR
jgi:predicted lipoprotein with Yx(FWY)xxD motif